MTQKIKKPTLLLTIGTAALLVGAGAGAYFALLQRGSGSGEMPVGANVIPQDAVMAISLTTDPVPWAQLREFGTAQSQVAFDKNLAQLRDRLLTANGFDYEKDIQPWVGKEVTIAFMPAQAAPTALSSPSPTPTISPDATTPETPTGLATPSSPNPLPPVPQPSPSQSAMVVLPIQDAQKARELLGKPRPLAGKLVARTYKDVQIQEIQGTAAQKYSFAALDQKLVVVATDAKTMDRAIDAYRGEPALAATPGYAQALAKIQSPQPLGKIFVNLPVAASSPVNAGRTPPVLAQSQDLQGLASTVTLEPEGIRFKSAYWLKPESQRKREVKNSTSEMPKRLPSDTILMASGGSLKRFWRDYTEGSAVNPALPFKPELLRDGLKSTINMDLDQDFLSWMDGEFSVALVAAPEGGAASVPFSLLFMVQATDRRAAETALQQLDQAMASKYNFKVEPSQVGNQPVVNWGLPFGGPAIAHGWLDGNVAFLSIGAPIINLLIPKPAASLADSESFKQSISPELVSNNGHFFVNVERAMTARNLPLPQFPLINRDLLAAIRSIGVTAAYNDERTIRFDVFALLQKAGKPALLPSPTMPASPSASPTTPTTEPSPSSLPPGNSGAPVSPNPPTTSPSPSPLPSF